MAFQPAPFDVVEASRRVWLERWDADAASGMAVFTAVLRTYQLLKDGVDEVVSGHGLTFPRYQVLAWLAMDPESSMALSWIGRTLRVPPASVTNIIDYLEGEGLVRRESHPTDARTTLAVITAKGRKLAARVTQDLNTDVYERIGLDEGERHQLLGLLGELRANGNEFDVDRSAEVLEDLDARSTPGSARGKGRADVA